MLSTMNSSLALCFAPLVATFLIFVIVIKDLRLLSALWACVLGLAAVLPIAFVQLFVGGFSAFNGSGFASLLLTAIVFNGVIEEAFKMLFLLLLPRKKTTVAAFFCCSLLFGLALGSFESLVYLVRRLQSVSQQDGVAGVYKLLLVRMATSVLVHTFCAGLSGLGIQFAMRCRLRLLPFVYAMLLHGIYNFFAAFAAPFRYFSVAAVLFAALECRICYQALRPLSVVGAKVTEVY